MLQSRPDRRQENLIIYYELVVCAYHLLLRTEISMSDSMSEQLDFWYHLKKLILIVPGVTGRYPS